MINNSKNKIRILPEIRGAAIKAAREKLCLTPADLGFKACLSKKHIIELEEGGISSFYSEAHKITVAKKVAKILQLDESKVLVHPDGDLALQNSLEFDLTPEFSSPEEATSPSINPLELPTKDKVSFDGFNSNHMIARPDGSRKTLKGIGSLFLVLAVTIGLYLTKDDIAQVFFSKTKFVESEQATLEETKVSEAAPQAPSNPPMTSQLQAVVSAPDSTCPKADSSVADYVVIEPSKPGNFVFVEAKVKQVVCVVDASGKSSLQTIEAGSNYTFTGKAPFTILSDGFQQLAVFFQGRPVRPSNERVRTLRLIEGK